MAAGGPIVVYVDADACPVKDEVYRVAARHGLKVQVVATARSLVPREPWIERVVVGEGPMDVADDWIAERAGPNAIVVTADVPLAARCVKAGAMTHRAERAHLRRGIHRHGARHPQPDGRHPLGGRADARPAGLLAPRPLGLPLRHGSHREPAEARGVRQIETMPVR
jgi:hypothetical protein